MVNTFFQKYGTFLLAVVMAIVTAGVHFGSVSRDMDAVASKVERLDRRVDSLDKEGSAYARETRQQIIFQGQTVSDIKVKTDKALELLSTQREATARMEQQIAYLVLQCGKNASGSQEAFSFGMVSVISSH